MGSKMKSMVAVSSLFCTTLSEASSHAFGESWGDLLALQASLHPHGVTPRVYVAQASEIHGRGVFASEDLPAGATVAVAWFDFVFTPGGNRTAASYDGDLGDTFVNGGGWGGGSTSGRGCGTGTSGGGAGDGDDDGGSDGGGGGLSVEDGVFTEHHGYLPQGNDLPLGDLFLSGLLLGGEDVVVPDSDGLVGNMKVPVPD
jgi:hypothetical protein